MIAREPPPTAVFSAGHLFCSFFFFVVERFSLFGRFCFLVVHLFCVVALFFCSRRLGLIDTVSGAYIEVALIATGAISNSMIATLEDAEVRG